MERADFERELMTRLQDIRALYAKYYPEVCNSNTEYLCMFISEGRISANNRYFGNDYDRKVNCWTDENGEFYNR